MQRFSEDFLLGAATSAHQVEGNNIHSDYWLMEHMRHTNFSEASGKAVDHYNRYKEDIKLLHDAGLNAYRFSVEWARIEPTEGVFDEEEMNHYKDVVSFCKGLGVEPVITLHHFTSPAWLIKKGGWENENTISYFARYAEYVIKNLNGLVKYVVTINEANMGIQVAAIAERYKRIMMQKLKNKGKNKDPKNKNVEGTAQVGMNFNTMLKNMFFARFENRKLFKTGNPETFVSARSEKGDILVMRAHLAAKEKIKSINPGIMVGLSLSLHDIQSTADGTENAKKEWNDEFLHYLPYIKNDDFFGLQNYSRSVIGKDGIMPVPENAEITQMEYEYYPEALRNVTTRVNEEFKAAGVNMPIIVTENGIATDNDKRRVAFIDTATEGVAWCIKMGIPVKGYFYWSLLDNFEWQKGFSMTFGLIKVDRNTMERIPKESLYFLGKLKSND